MSLLIFIPARGGSKGIPLKNLSSIGDKKLIDFTIETAISISKKKQIFISTDNKEINDHCNEQNLGVNYIRPTSISQDTSTIIEALFDALKWLEETKNYSPNEVLLLQPTSPFRNNKEINEAISYFYDNSLDSLFGVVKMREHPEECIVGLENSWSYLDNDKEYSNYQRQQYSNNFYYIDGSFYLCSVAFLKKHQTFIVKNMSTFYKFNYNNNLDIDVQKDLELARAIYNYNK